MVHVGMPMILPSFVYMLAQTLPAQHTMDCSVHIHAQYLRIHAAPGEMKAFACFASARTHVRCAPCTRPFFPCRCFQLIYPIAPHSPHQTSTKPKYAVRRFLTKLVLFENARRYAVLLVNDSGRVGTHSLCLCNTHTGWYVQNCPKMCVRIAIIHKGHKRAER